MQFTFIISALAICAQLASGASISARDFDERRTPVNTVCTPASVAPLSADCATLAARLVAKGAAPIRLRAGEKLQYKQGTCKMVFRVTANETITYTKLNIAENIAAINTKCLGVGKHPAVGSTVAKNGHFTQTISLSV